MTVWSLFQDFKIFINVKHSELRLLIKEEISKYFETHPYSLETELILENEIWIGELLNPDTAYPYEGSKGYYEYKDVSGDTFFARLVYQPPPSGPFMEFKTGWINDKGVAQYEPAVPPNSKNSSAIYVTKRSDTVAKIYRDEILPFFEKQDLTNTMVIRPISTGRMKFAERLVKNFTPTDKFDIEYGSPLIITKKNGKT
jgi:hypothetical protein